MATASYVEKLEVILDLCLLELFSTHYLSNPETELELDSNNLLVQPTGMDLE